MQNPNDLSLSLQKSIPPRATTKTRGLDGYGQPDSSTSSLPPPGPSIGPTSFFSLTSGPKPPSASPPPTDPPVPHPPTEPQGKIKVQVSPSVQSKLSVPLGPVALINEIMIKTAEDGMEDRECLKFRVCRTASECCVVSQACMGKGKAKKFQANSKTIIKGSDLGTCEGYKLSTIHYPSFEILDLLAPPIINPQEGQGCWKGDYVYIELSNGSTVRCQNDHGESICVVAPKKIRYNCNIRLVSGRKQGLRKVQNLTSYEFKDSAIYGSLRKI